MTFRLLYRNFCYMTMHGSYLSIEPQASKDAVKASLTGTLHWTDTSDRRA